jgi:hypothetical protein
MIHIPARNCILPGNPIPLRPLETYAKRSKLYAAFAKFGYQRHELALACEKYNTAPSEPAQQKAAQGLMALVRHFLSIDLRYDFWNRVPEWKPIGWSHVELRYLDRFLRDPAADQSLAGLRDYLATYPAYPLRRDYVEELDLSEAQGHFYAHLVQVWERLDNLSRMYEELVREWFLPTSLATLLGEDLRAIPPAAAG